MEGSKKVALTQKHIKHGIQFFETNKPDTGAEVRCTRCDLFLWWASGSETSDWLSFGNRLKCKPATKPVLKLVCDNTRGET